MTAETVHGGSNHLMPTLLLKGILYAIGGVTIAAGLYFAAIGRPLLTAIICFAALLPAGLLALVIQRKSPRPQGVELLQRQRQTSRLILIIGIVAVVAGGILMLVAPGGLAKVFLWMGPGMALGGGAIHGWARSELAKREN